MKRPMGFSFQETRRSAASPWGTPSRKSQEMECAAPSIQKTMWYATMKMET